MIDGKAGSEVRNDLCHAPILRNLRGVAGLLVSLTASRLRRWTGCLCSFLSLVLWHGFRASTLYVSG